MGQDAIQDLQIEIFGKGLGHTRIAVTKKLDNTAEYENWLIIQDYIDQQDQIIREAREYVKQERDNHFNNVKLCSTKFENLLLSSALCTCDHTLEILDRNVK